MSKWALILLYVYVCVYCTLYIGRNIHTIHSYTEYTIVAVILYYLCVSMYQCVYVLYIYSLVIPI